MLKFLTPGGHLAKRFATRQTLIASLSLAGFFAASVPDWSFAQDSGGMQLRFGVANRISANDNPGLQPVSTGQKTRISTGLSFGFLSETRDARLQFNTRATLRWNNGSTTNKRLTDPDFDLSYTQVMGWDGHFEADASLRETDLSDNDDLQVFDTGTGTRIEGNLNSKLTWGDTGPVGLGVSVGSTIFRYSSTDPALIDSTAFRLGLSSRFDLSPISRLELRLSASRFEQAVTAPTRTTIGLTSKLAFSRPDGETFAAADIFDTPEGQRLSLSVGHKVDLTRGRFSLELGAAKGTSGNTYAIGALDYAYEMPLGTFYAKVSRRLSAGSDDTERLVTDVNARYQRTLGKLTTLHLSLGWADSQSPQTNLSVTNGNASATLNRRLTDDWGVDVGYRHQGRNDQRNATKGRSNTVFMELKRDVTILR